MKRIFAAITLIFCAVQLHAQNNYANSRFGLSYVSLAGSFNIGNFKGFNNYINAFNQNPQPANFTMQGKFGHAGFYSAWGMNIGFRLGIKGLYGELNGKFSEIDKTASAVYSKGKFDDEIMIQMRFGGGSIYQQFKVGNSGYWAIGMSGTFMRYRIRGETDEVTEYYSTLGKMSSFGFSPFLQYKPLSYPMTVRVFYTINKTMYDYGGLNRFSNSAPVNVNLKSPMSMFGLEIALPLYYAKERDHHTTKYHYHKYHPPVYHNHPNAFPNNNPQSGSLQKQHVQPHYKISGKLLDKRTGKPIAGEMKIVHTASKYSINVKQDTITGKYEVVLDTIGIYEVVVMAKDHLNKEERIELHHSTQGQSLTKDIFMDPVVVGQAVRINNILFEKGTADLNSSSYESLDKLGVFLTDNPEIHIELGGHTSNEGSALVNQKLSEDRAAAVKTYLSGKGVSADRMTIKGYGSSHPVTGNDTEANRAMNRRVEYKIIKK